MQMLRCGGCGACAFAFACKAENNARNRGDGQSFNWADFMMKTEGTFPNVTHWVMPVLCNHCSNAPCVEECPAEPKALFKTPEGVTMHDTELCIGCRKCQRVCPYSNRALGPESLNGETYSVISYNPDEQPTQPFWADKAAAIQGGTSSGADVARAAGAATPAMNLFAAGNVKAIRTADKVEKCTFCYHRTSNGLQPACVEVCPSKVRIFGDQDDPKPQIAQVLQKEKSFRLKEEAGARPNVHYIGKYSARG